MKKNIIGLLILIFLSTLGYKIMMNFKETNEIEILFHTNSNTDLKDLRVNLFVIRSDAPSEWYSYYKVITVIDNGAILTNFKSKYIVAYQVEGMSKLNKLYFNSELLDNVFAHKEDYKVSYTFDRNYVGINSGSTLISNGDVENQKYSTTTHTNELKYHNPQTTHYQISDISEEDMLFLKTKSFDELKNVSKIKTGDIFKLSHLTNKERLELVKIHNTKKFNKPLD